MNGYLDLYGDMMGGLGSRKYRQGYGGLNLYSLTRDHHRREQKNARTN